MKRILLAFALLFGTMLSASAQCTGNAASGRVCGNSAATSAPASYQTLTAMFDRALCSTNNSAVARISGTWVCLASANNGVWVTSAAGVPSISSTLPNAVQDAITRLGTVTSAGGITISPTASSLNKGFNITQTPAGVGGATSTDANTISVTDTVDAEGGSFNGLGVYLVTGGLSSKGSRAAVFGRAVQGSPAGTVGTCCRDLIGGWFDAISGTPNGGVPGTPLGTAYGLQLTANLFPGATNYLAVAGAEVDVVAQVGSSVDHFYGVNIVHGAGVGGSVIDAALPIGGSSPGWGYALLLGNGTDFPMATTGCVICALTTQTIATGIDLSNETITGNFLKGPGGFAVTGAGALTAASVTYPAPAVSVIGNSTGSTANVAPIAAGANGNVLRRDVGLLGFGTLDLTNANTVAAFPAISVLGNATGSSAAPTQIVAGADGRVLRQDVGLLGFGGLDLSNTTTFSTGILAVARGGTGITSFGAGIATFLGTPSSANLAAAVTGETGSGALVFGTSPAIVTPAITGFADASTAASGIVGEPLDASVALDTVSMTNNTAANITSLSLTAGDWEVSGTVYYFGASGLATPEYMEASIGTTSATRNLTVGAFGADVRAAGVAVSGNGRQSIHVPTRRVSLSSTTTVYLVGYVTFGAGAITAGGNIHARRMR